MNKIEIFSKFGFRASKCKNSGKDRVNINSRSTNGGLRYLSTQDDKLNFKILKLDLTFESGQLLKSTNKKMTTVPPMAMTKNIKNIFNLLISVIDLNIFLLMNYILHFFSQYK